MRRQLEKTIKDGQKIRVSFYNTTRIGPDQDVVTMQDPRVLPTLLRGIAWAATDDDARAFVTTYREPSFLAGLAATEGPRHLDADFELVQDTFRRFAEEQRLAAILGYIADCAG